DMHGVPDGRLTRVELGRSRPLGETPAQHYPRSKRRARRLPAPALGALTAVLVIGASWPAAVSAGIHRTGPGASLSPGAPASGPSTGPAARASGASLSPAATASGASLSPAATASGASPSPAPTPPPWLLGRAAPALLGPHHAADAPAVTDAKVAPL